MKKTINKIITSGLLVCASTIQAQTLTEFLQTALEQNYQISILKNETGIAANNNTIGNTGQLPTLGFTGTASKSSNNTLQKFADGSTREGTNAANSNMNFSLLANWTVFDGFRVYAKQDQLAALEQIGQLNSKFYIEQTAADIAVVYYQLVFQKQLLESYNKSFEISKYRFQLEQKRMSVGSGKGMDYQQAVLDFQTDSMKILTQENTIKLLEIEINRLMNANLENNISIENQEMNFLSLPDKDSILIQIKNNNQQIKQQHLQELITETSLRMERADMYPKLNLFTGYQFTKSFAEVGFVNSNRNTGPVLGVNISFNLYNGGNTQREIQNANLVKDNSALKTLQLNQNLDADALKLHYQYASLKQRLNLAENNVLAAEKVYLIAEEQLKKGAINGYDFRLTQLSLLENRNVLSQLNYSLKALEIGLNRVSGTVLSAYMN